MSELVITNYKNSIISAVYDNKEMVQVTACRKKTTAGIGNIYVGRIDNIVKNINAAFVNISEQLSCYLDLSGIKQPLFVKKQSEKKISIGDELLVQIVKEDVKTKAPVVTTNISLTGKYIVLVHGGEGIQISKKIQQKAVRNSFKPMLEGMVREQTGIVVRTNAQYVSREEIEREAALLFEEYDQILKTGVHQTKYSLVHQELPQYLQQLRDSREAAMDKVVTNIPAVYREFESYLKKYPVKTAEGQSLKLELAEDANDLVDRKSVV